MKAIITRYHGPTNTRGARITASDSDGNRVTIPYRYDLNTEDAHAMAAYALREKMQWWGVLIGGRLRVGYVWVFEDGKRVP